jgi:multidrug efflux system membrane fusion protein
VKVTFLRDAADAEAQTAARAVALAPKAALRVEGDQTYVFVVDGQGLVDRRAVKAGGADGDRVEILAGLNSGERIVVSPPSALATGARVVVKQ